MGGRLYESDFEQTTIERLKQLGYEHVPAYELYNRTNLGEVVLHDRLQNFLRRTYPGLPTEAMAALFTNPDGLTWQQRNRRFHEMLVKGVDFGYEVGQKTEYAHVAPIDWDNPDNNDFVVVNQLP
uniref:type I restriction endonuclease n=1 Tax=Alicyclobacillus sendaiensis TaxID=192387 RepID=UPI000A966001